MAKKRLTVKEKKFVLVYAKNFNASEAYREAFGYTGVNAKHLACRIMRKPMVTEAIEEAIEEAVGPYEKDLKENVQFWIKMRDDPEERAANRLKASEHLAKYRAMFTDKHDVNVQGAVTIVDDI